MATNFPTSIDDGTSLPYPSSTDDLSSPNLAAGQGNQNDAVIAVETKVGTGSASQTPTAGYILRSTTDGESTWDLSYPTSATLVGLTDTQTLTNKTIDAANNTITNLSGSDIASGTITSTQIANNTITSTNIDAASVGALFFPVGCIYTETTGINPNTTFGFGTWVAFGEGRVLIGNGTSDETYTAGDTGGASNTTLTVNQMPSHNHTVAAQPNTTGGTTYAGVTNTATGSFITSSMEVSNTGGGASFSNMNPYIVVYFWERTA